MLEWFRYVGREGVRVETAGFHINWIIADVEPASARGGPCDVDAARQHAEAIGIVERNTGELVVRHDRHRQELEDAVLRRLDSRYIAGRRVFPIQTART